MVEWLDYQAEKAVFYRISNEQYWLLYGHFTNKTTENDFVYLQGRNCILIQVEFGKFGDEFNYEISVYIFNCKLKKIIGGCERYLWQIKNHEDIKDMFSSKNVVQYRYNRVLHTDLQISQKAGRLFHMSIFIQLETLMQNYRLKRLHFQKNEKEAQYIEDICETYHFYSKIEKYPKIAQAFGQVLTSAVGSQRVLNHRHFPKSQILLKKWKTYITMASQQKFYMYSQIAQLEESVKDFYTNGAKINGFKSKFNV